MTRFIKKPTVIIQNGQKTVTGEIFLAKHTKVFNIKNQGLSPLDHRYRDNKVDRNSIVLPAGTKVRYTMQETHTGSSHTISYTTFDKYTYQVTRQTKTTKG